MEREKLLHCYIEFPKMMFWKPATVLTSMKTNHWGALGQGL